MSDKPPFFEALFDLSFSSFITTRVIKVLYVLAMILAAIASLGVIIAGFSNGFLAGLGGLLFGGLLFLVYVLAARVSLELIMIIFQIHEDVASIARSKGPAQNP